MKASNSPILWTLKWRQHNARNRSNGESEGESLNGASGSRGRIIVADDNWQSLFELPF